MQPYEHGGDVYGKGDIRLDFSVNTNPLGMPENVKQAILANMDGYVRYPDPHCRALVGAIAAHHGVAGENVLCGNGAADLIFRICACLKPKTVLTPAPTFSEYARSAEVFGSAIRTFSLAAEDGFALKEDFLTAITPGVNMVFLCTPNNPTGRLIPRELIRKTAEACKRIGAILVLDECFMGFTGGPSMVEELSQHPNLLILRAFTKLYAMAGLRLGYLLCADGALLKRIESFGAAWSVSAPAQAAGVAALQAEPAWGERTRALAAEERQYLSAALKELGVTVYPSDGNFLLLEWDHPLYAPLLARGIYVRPCANFTGLDERYIRIGIKTHEDNAALVRAISEVING